MDHEYDLLVIGAGMAGISAATKCASQGWRVGIVDDLPYGGTCALRGCDPKKILRRGAEVVEAARLMAGKGVLDPGLAMDWAALNQHKHTFTDPLPQQMEQNLRTHGVDALHGPAQFTGPRSVLVAQAEHTAAKVLIATGAVPRPLDFPGSEHLIDSTEFLNLTDLPGRIVFLGGGFISFEFAHIAARAGSTTVIVDRGVRPLKEFDADLVELLVARGAEAGVEVRRRTSIASIEKTGTGYTVSLETPRGTTTVETDLVVHGAGRQADLARLNLEAAGVRYGDAGVEVEAHLQSTTNPRVYAAGDAAATPGRPLTPVAVAEAKVAASNMLKSATAVPDYSATPTTVFSIPELVRIGMLEEEARASGVDVEVRYTDTSGWYSQHRIGEHAGAVKILVDRSDDRIVGAHLFGADYAELGNTISLAMKHGLTASQLRSANATYPSVGSDLGSLL